VKIIERKKHNSWHKKNPRGELLFCLPPLKTTTSYATHWMKRDILLRMTWFRTTFCCEQCLRKPSCWLFDRTSWPSRHDTRMHYKTNRLVIIYELLNDTLTLWNRQNLTWWTKFADLENLKNYCTPNKMPSEKYIVFCLIYDSLSVLERPIP
jgi:hypothetical protein